MSVRLGYVEASWFRGFCGPQRVTFDASATVIYGPNGSGKSSIVEALEWVFFAEIGRAVHAANRQEYLSQRHVQNPRRPADACTYVEVGVQVNDDDHVLRRELVDLYTTRLVVGDRQVADIGEAFGLSLHDMRRPVVSRSEGRMLIDASPTGRWDRLVSLLGVDIFAQARRELTQEAQRLARASELQQTDTLLVEMRRFPELTHAADAADRTMFRRSDLTAALVAAAAGEGVSAASPAAAVAGLEALAPPARPPLPPSPSAAATAAVTQAREAVAALQEPPAVGSDRARQALLRDGLRVVKDGDPTCPFCGEPTLNADRLNAIRAQLDSLGNAAEAERTRQTQLGDVRAAASGLAGWLPADTYRDQCSAAGATAEAVSAVLVKLDGVRTLADTARNRLTSLTECSASSDWPECRATAEGALTDMSTAVDDLQRVEREMMESPPQDNDRDQVADQRRVALRRACENEELLARGGGIRTVRARVDGLCQELKRTEREAVRNRIHLVSDRVVQLYERLNPEEGVKPTRLHIHEGERNEVRLLGESYGADLNPVTTFSDGHLHCLAIALAIPCRVEFNPDWDVLVVDDPLFGIDTGHSARMAELLADLVHETGKQLVATTYYAQFARDMEHLADAQRWEVSPYSADGLQIEAKGDEIETLVRTAEVLKAGEAAARREAGGKLRDAFELLTDRIGRPYGSRGQMNRKWRIEQRIDRLDELGVDGDLIRRLRTVGDRVNKASHAEETDPTPEELGWCCEHLRELAAQTARKGQVRSGAQ